MERNKYALLIILFLMIMSCDTANNVPSIFKDHFVKFYGGDGDQEGVDLVLNPDGTMILLGNYISPSRPFMVKVNGVGDIIWQRQLGGFDERAVDVELITSGIHAGKLVVVSNIGDEPNSRIRLTIIDQSSVGVDSIIFPSAVKQFAKSVTQTIDNGFVVAGYTAGGLFPTSIPGLPSDPVSNDVADLIGITVDENLTDDSVLLTIKQGGESNGSFIKIFQNEFEGETKYVALGYSDRIIAENNAGVIQKNFEAIVYDADGGQSLFQSAGDQTRFEVSVAAIESPDFGTGAFAMVGTSKANQSDVYGDLYLTSFKKDLSVIAPFRISLGFPIHAKALANAQPNGYFVVGNVLGAGNLSDILLVRLSFDGQVLNSRAFGSPEGDDEAGAVIQLPDGRVVILGTVGLETQKKMSLIIVNRDGEFIN